MSESDIAKKAKKLIKSVDDLVNTVKKDTATVIMAARELSDQLKGNEEKKGK